MLLRKAWAPFLPSPSYDSSNTNTNCQRVFSWTLYRWLVKISIFAREHFIRTLILMWISRCTRTIPFYQSSRVVENRHHVQRERNPPDLFIQSLPKPPQICLSFWERFYWITFFLNISTYLFWEKKLIFYLIFFRYIINGLYVLSWKFSVTLREEQK